MGLKRAGRGAGAEARGVAHDGAPPWLVCAGAADDGGGVQAAEDLEEEPRRSRGSDETMTTGPRPSFEEGGALALPCMHAVCKVDM